MKLFKILLILGVLLGGVIGTAVEIPSFAAADPISFVNGEMGNFYFPSTGYLVINNCYYLSSTIGKYVLPKNLTKSSLNKLKGNFPGVIMNMTGKNKFGYKVKKWVKRWDRYEFSGPYSYNPRPNTAGLINYINNNKFDNIYARAISTYKPHNTTQKNEQMLWSNKNPTYDCTT